MTEEERIAAVDSLLGEMTLAQLDALAVERNRIMSLGSEYDPGYTLSFARGTIADLQAFVLAPDNDSNPFQTLQDELLKVKYLLSSTGTINLTHVVNHMVYACRAAWKHIPPLGPIEA